MHPNKALAIDFLEKIIDNHSFVLQLEVVQVLFELDVSAVMRLKHSENKAINDICHQVLDFNL